MTDFDHLEAIAQEVIDSFEVTAPPVPIETMLQKPPNNMWSEVDVNQLSGNFLNIKDRYSPRMSLARLLTRHILSSEWGAQRGLPTLITHTDHVQAFARMLVMPREMITAMTTGGRNPTSMSIHFEVPEEDALKRLQELA